LKTHRPSSAANGRRDILAASGLLVLLAVLAAFMAVTHLRIVRDDRAWVRHSRDVIDQVQELFILVLDVESGQRGYMASQGDPRFLDRFEASRARIPAAEADLARLVAATPAQARAVAKFNAQIDARVAVSAQRVDLVRRGLARDALVVNFANGHTAMDAVRQTRADLMRQERELLAQRTQTADRADLISFSAALALGALSMLGLGLLMVSMMRANRRLAREIREREAAEAAWRDGEAQYRAIFDNTADLLYVLDVTSDDDFLIAEVNPAYERAVGLRADVVRGRSVGAIASAAQRDTIMAHLRTVAAGGTPVFSRLLVDLPSGPRTWESVIAPVRDGEGRIRRLVGSSRDVTERERAREQLRRAQRMEAVGQLTGGVAHDFNNLLQVIRGNLELIASQVGEGPATARIKNALHASERAAQLTRQLLAFSRRQPLEPRVINLGRLVTDMADMLRRSLGEAIEIETLIAGGLWNTLADPAQVESAVLNLALNARDAMPDGGRLTIEISNAALDENHARQDAEIEPGHYVLIAVSDTGQGMDRETLARVFEPFFTTKGEDRGTGLGLSMVHGFVKQSRGHVQIHSEIGQGTTVKLYLPRSRDAEHVPEIAPLGSLRGRSEVILVVEDDDLVRASAVGMLRDLGYACLHAADGAAALEILRSGAKIDLLFTDVIMPGPVKSRDLAREAQALRPGMPVLYTSGYTDNAIVHHGRLDEGVHLLSKPYSRDGLARKIRAMLKTVRPVVLVVEDDPLVRLSAVDMIDALGFTTLQAADATAALRFLNGGERVDILFTDIGLPGMRGPELAARAVQIRQGLKVIFASGYGDTEETAAIEDALHLAKPYEQDRLAEALTAAVR
jgi:PAS domain S-box-containing protein